VELGAGLAGIVDDYPEDQKLAELATLGLDFAEVTLRTTDDPGADAVLAARAGFHGVPVRSAVVDEFVRVADHAPAAPVLDGLRRLLARAGALGCSVVLLPVVLRAGEDERTARYAGALATLAGDAAGTGLVCGVEFVGGTPPARAAALVRAVAHPALRLYFDVGNCLWAGVDPVAALAEALPLVAQVHLKGGPETPLAALPLDRLGAVLAAGGYRGRACLEIEPAKGRSALRDAVAVVQMAGLWRRPGPGP
jgi:sugar phosphate isomerase/epimerase